MHESHWPIKDGKGRIILYAVNPLIAKQIVGLLNAVDAIEAHDRKLDDPHGDGTGNDAQPPTGDDYNEVVGLIRGAMAA